MLAARNMEVPIASKEFLSWNLVLPDFEKLKE